MGLADLHIHTVYSDGMGTVPAVLEAASQTDLHLIAITDHEEIRGALEAQDLASKYGIEVIPGTEIATAEGHLVALFVQTAFPPHRPLRETVLRVAEEGGLCIAVHPTANFIHSLSAASILWALTDPEVARTLVGIEVYNAGLPQLGNNQRAQSIGDHTQLAQVANSDSHLLWTIGLAATEFPGTTAQSLREALLGGLTKPVVNQRPRAFIGSWVKGWLLRQAGLAYCSTQPGSGVVLRRLSSAPS